MIDSRKAVHDVTADEVANTATTAEDPAHSLAAATLEHFVRMSYAPENGVLKRRKTMEF